MTFQWRLRCFKNWQASYTVW